MPNRDVIYMILNEKIKVKKSAFIFLILKNLKSP